MVGAGFDRVIVPGVPTHHTLSFALRALLEENEKEAEVQIMVRPPSGPSLRFTHVLRAGNGQPHQGHVGVPLAINLGMPIIAEGLHVVTVILEADDHAELTFDVEVSPGTPQASV